MERSKHWVFTLNNYSEAEYEDVLTKECVYLVVGKEVGESGTPHLQGYIVMPSLKSLAQMKKVVGDRAHLERAKGTASQNFAYCSKDSDFTETGSRPADPGRSGGEANRERWQRALDQAEAGEKVDDPQIRLVHHRAIKAVRIDLLMSRELEDTTEQMLWYWGKSRTGKSRAAIALFPKPYKKLCNKWWDGYVDQHAVVIEDFDALHWALGTHLKIWADRYPFNAEIKGGQVMIRPKVIIVTSNYHPSSIWHNEETLVPITNRFKCVEFVKE